MPCSAVTLCHYALLSIFRFCFSSFFSFDIFIREKRRAGFPSSRLFLPFRLITFFNIFFIHLFFFFFIFLFFFFFAFSFLQERPFSSHQRQHIRRRPMPAFYMPPLLFFFIFPFSPPAFRARAARGSAHAPDETALRAAACRRLRLRH